MGKILTLLLMVALLFSCNSAANTVEEKETIVINQEKIEESEAGTRNIIITNIEEPFYPEFSTKMEDVGEMTTVIENQPEDLIIHNDNIKIKVDKYVLSQINVKEEFKPYFKDSFEDTDKIAIIGIWLDIENKTKEEIPLGPILGTIHTNTGEQHSVSVVFNDGKVTIDLKADEDEDGTITSTFNSVTDKINEITIKLEGFDDIQLNW